METSYIERVYGSSPNVELSSIDKKLIASLQRLQETHGKSLEQRKCSIYFVDKPNTDVTLDAPQKPSNICKGIKKDGTHCCFKAKTDSEFCGRHMNANKS